MGAMSVWREAPYRLDRDALSDWMRGAIQPTKRSPYCTRQGRPNCAVRGAIQIPTRTLYLLGEGCDTAHDRGDLTSWRRAPYRPQQGHPNYQDRGAMQPILYLSSADSRCCASCQGGAFEGVPGGRSQRTLGRAHPEVLFMSRRRLQRCVKRVMHSLLYTIAILSSRRV